MPFDIFFISYNETEQEENWKQVLQLHPSAIRLHGVTGIDTVHVACNRLSKSRWFWTIDGDNYLKDTLTIPDKVYDPWLNLIMFKADDPLTGNLTNLGGAKLWRKDSLINFDMSKGDFCLNAVAPETTHYIDKSVTITKYNSSPYDAWKTAFRHCVKLTSEIIEDRPLATNISNHLAHWESCKELDNGTNNASWCHKGYLDATEFVNNSKNISFINDYKWLRTYFKEKYNA